MLQMRKRGPPHYHELLDQIGGKRFGLVDAARLFGERITGQGISPAVESMVLPTAILSTWSLSENKALGFINHPSRSKKLTVNRQRRYL